MLYIYIYNKMLYANFCIIRKYVKIIPIARRYLKIILYFIIARSYINVINLKLM